MEDGLRTVSMLVGPLACDGQGRPLAFTIMGGNVNDCTQFEPVMARIAVKRDGPGRPRIQPDRVAGDKGCSSRKIRASLRLWLPTDIADTPW
ncbi:hypothetical protein [Streptomyces sp. CS057]|uniref:hypothetical protein n=1 Tax=Streptomyces sp. CS057 TaxID=1982764 RepID=UPI00211AEA3B|nr:hypothetical protein [Streptomyces sp. CS057]